MRAVSMNRLVWNMRLQMIVSIILRSDYNTVLNEAQREQRRQARPELHTKIDAKKWAEYDTIILGYPNWWASIPIPIAKLATKAQWLSVHYSGGSTLAKDVEAWLRNTGAK